MQLLFLTPAVALLGTLAACSSAPARLDRAGPLPPTAQRVGLEEATHRVRAQIMSTSPDMSVSAEFPLVELTTDEIWDRLGAQLFQVDEGVRGGESFLVCGERALPLCSGFGGHGIQSACVTDLDGDQIPELTYTYSWGSGIHRSLVGVCRVDGDRLLQEELPLAFVGDLFVRKESDSWVSVEIGRYGWAFGSWEPDAPLGELVGSPGPEFLTPRIRLAPLSEEHTQSIWRLGSAGSLDDGC